MIEFNGVLSQEAQNFFWRESAKNMRKILVIPAILFLLIILYVALLTKYWALLVGYVVFCFLVSLLLLLPKGKKERARFARVRIYIDGEYIVYQNEALQATGVYEEFLLISDAESLVDFGNFYYISFPPGKRSEKFICQKDLLVKGTIKEFEALFDGKIIRK